MERWHNMLHGYFMKIAEVDLSDNKIKYLDLEEKDLRKYIGGSGLGAKFLYEYTNHQTDPLGPENVLIFSVINFNGFVNFEEKIKLTIITTTIIDPKIKIFNLKISPV